MNTLDFIALRDSLDVSNYDSVRCVLNNGDGKYYLINERTRDLVTKLKQANSWDEAYGHFMKDERADLTLDEFIKFIHSVLHISNHSDNPDTKKSYLRLRLTIIKKDLAAKLGDAFSFLFQRGSFFYALSILLFANLAFAFFTSRTISPPKDGWSYLIVTIIYIISVFLHEIGHISSCRKFGAKHGGVGIGFYLVFPVSWADVTGLWMLPRKERVITNLAGIYIQLLTNILIIAIYFITGKSYLLLAADLIFVTSLFQLWPFMRYDGYWILSDTLEAPNLMSLSANKFRSLVMEWSGNQPKRKKSSKDWYLIIYAFSNAFLTGLYILYVVVNHGEIVIHYPSVTEQLVISLINGHLTGSELFVNYLVVSLFYYIVIKKTVNFVSTRINLKGFHLFHLSSFKA